NEQQGCGCEKRDAAAPAKTSGVRQRLTDTRGTRLAGGDRGAGDRPCLGGPNARIGVGTESVCEAPLELVEVMHREVLPGAEAAGARAGRGRQTKTCRARVRSRRS